MSKQVNHYDLAIEALSSWLYEQFEKADFVNDVMSNDPECVLLLDEDWDTVLDCMSLLKLNIVLK